MYGIRRDGIAVKLPIGIYDTRETAIGFVVKNDFLAVMLEGKYVFAGPNPFTKTHGNVRVLPTVTEAAKPFTDTDEGIREMPFYFRGLFGMTSKGEILTRLFAQDFVTALGNTFRVYLRGSDIVFLTIDSPAHLSMSDVKNDAITLAAETHGLGKSVGLVITPRSIGYFNMKN